MFHNSAQIFLLILLNILSASCTRNSSLTFVIDDTGSMWNNIQAVKLAAKDIMKAIAREKASEIADVVLVTFNDPGTTTDPAAVLRKKTVNYSELKKALDDIKVHTAVTNNDCAEYSLSGIELALQESRPNSYLFVFTDATAKDFEKLDEIKRLCEMKQSQVTFILTGNCGKPHEKPFLVYHEIARISAGQVFTIPKEDVEDVLQTIEETVKGKTTVLLWKLMAPSFILKAIPFQIDDKTDYVIVSTSGLDVELKVTKSRYKRARQVPHETLLLNKRGKVLKIKGTPGTYYAWVRGDTDVTVVIYARTDFTIEHGFSEFMPKSMDDVSKLPIAGRKHYLSISVTDPENTVRIGSAQIVDMHNQVLNELPLKKSSGNFYITDAFISPSTMFKIKVTGTIIKTGQDIQRTSQTAFEPVSPPEPKPKIPEVTISEGTKVKVDFGKDIILTCTASGYPVPTFVWSSEDGRVFNTKSYIKEEPYDYISYLKLSNVQRSNTYRCKVANNEGQSNSTIEVIAGSPFKITPSPMSLSETTKVEYGVGTKLRCDVKSEYPMEIKWNTPLRPADYDIADGGKEIIIKTVDIKSQGKYSCEAALKTGAENDKIKHTISTNIVISNLELPSINSTSSDITVTGETVEIKCKLSAGIPPASVSWKIKRNGDDDFRDILASGEVLLINMTLANAGLYKCIARNPLGSVEKDTEIIVSQAPEITIDDTPNIIVPYLSGHEFTCRIIAKPLPRVTWMDIDGTELVSAVNIKLSNDTITSKIKIYDIRVNNTLYCHAENSLGKSVNHIDVTVISPFVVTTIPTENYDIHYGASFNIVCDIKSSLPMKIKWFHQKSGHILDVKSLKTSDKYAISSDGTTLHITNMDIELAGKYTCEAFLESNHYKKISYTTNLRIDDLKAPDTLTSESPLFSSAISEIINVPNGELIRISCTVSPGVPPANVSWYVRRNGDDEFRHLPTPSEQLIIRNITLIDAGFYKCIAKNPIGEIAKDIEIIVNQAPETIIDKEEGTTIPYGSNEELTCRIVANPLPSVSWKDADGNELLPATTTVNNDTTISKVKINNMKANKTFNCHAENSLGKSVYSVNVTVLSPFIVSKHPIENTDAHYGVPRNVICDIKSLLPMKLKWFYQKSDNILDISRIQSSDKYLISPDGMMLNITSMDMELAGKYTCEASLESDDDEKISFTTNVQIVDLKAPDTLTLESPLFSSDTSGVINVLNGELTRILCKASPGVPPANVSWHVRKNGDDEFRHLPTPSKQLIIRNITLTDAGFYRCIAKNPIGEMAKDIEIIVNQAPETIIDKVEITTIPYGSNEELTCRIVSNPLPSVSWKDVDGNEFLPAITILNNDTTISKVKINNIKANKTFYCHAENSLGKSVYSVNVTVLSPFIVSKHPIESTDVHYGAPLEIVCDIKSILPMKMKWLYQISDNVSKLEEDGDTLIIPSMNLEFAGKYTCEASLESDENEKISYTTNVRIDNLRAPDLIVSTSPSFSTPMSEVMTIKSGETFKMYCKISAGVPPPADVSWQVFKNIDDEERQVPTLEGELIIKNITLADAGSYTCTTYNSEGLIRRVTEIVVNKAPESTIDETANVTIAYGSNQEFTCTIIGNPLPTVAWKDNNEEGFPSFQGNYVMRNDTIISKIKIYNITANNTYTCHAENSLGKSRSSVDITVLSPFVVSTHPTENIFAQYNTSLNITCDITSSLPIKMKWFHQNNITYMTMIQTSDKYEISSDGLWLNIIAIDSGLIGKYTCEASLEFDENETISYTTNVQIDGLSQPYIRNIYAGVFKGVTGDKVLRIPCDVDGFPEPKVTWKSLGKVVTSDAKITVLKNELFINNPTEEDSRNFTCEAVNELGSDKREFSALISDYIDVPGFLDYEITIYLVRGESKDIQCNLSHADAQAVRWFLNGAKTDVHGSYPIKNATFAHDGNYTCRVNTDQGSFAQNYVVDVGYEPRFLADHQIEVNWYSAKGDTLDCSVSAKPIAEIEWYYNGKALGKSHQIFITGFGNYSCKATNVHGSVSRTVRVTNTGCAINRTVDSIQKTPLLFYDGSDSWPYLISEHEFLLFDRSEAISLVCATEDQVNNTFITHPTEFKLYAKCVKENIFLVQGKEYLFNELQCEEVVKPSFVKTHETCMTSGEIIKVGYKLGSFLEAYVVCYDEANERVLYTHAEYIETNLGNTVGPNFDWDLKIEPNRSKDILECQYNLRYLVQSIDVAFGPAQIATLSDKYNTIRVYEPCKASNRISWGDIEEQIQANFIDSIHMWTGGNHYDGETPRYLWKVVTFDYVLFETVVYVNTPNPLSSDILCSNSHTIAYELGFSKPIKDPYTFSCSMDEFLKAFNYTDSDFMDKSSIYLPKSNMA